MSNETLSIDYGDTDVAPPPESPADPQATAAARRGRPPRATREVTREPVREAPRLQRRRRDSVDPFRVPQDIIPEGMTYQWNAVTVMGNADVVLDKTMGYYENHWRAVPAERHPGMFLPYGSTGSIIRGGMRLEERPKYLTDEAMAEQAQIARQQMQIQSESVMGRMSKALPDGFAQPNATQRRAFKTGGNNLRMSIDPALDVPAPGYTLADSGE